MKSSETRSRNFDRLVTAPPFFLSWIESPCIRGGDKGNTEAYFEVEMYTAVRPAYRADGSSNHVFRLCLENRAGRYCPLASAPTSHQAPI